ncbi:MAG: hypothetical protein LUQ59_11950 [Methanothrix sp.]|nr:hypothetical protein [Methanothrix sp.]
MKKGCFFSAIIFLTVIVGVGFYLIKRYYPEIKKYAKEKIIKISLKDLDEEIDKLQKNEYQDSLRTFIKVELNKLKDKDFEDSMNKFGNVMKHVKILMKDNIIDSTDFTDLKNMVREDERPTKN